MKKLLVAAMGATAAFGAFAYTNAVRFEGAAGDKTAAELNVLAQSWNDIATGTYVAAPADTAGTNQYAITVYSEGSEGLPSACPLDGDGQAFEIPMTTALSVKTQFGKPLEFNVDPTPAGKDIGDGLYFDSLVKFTVCDGAPEQEYADAKIVMWLQTNEAETQTNLMVKAGYLSVNDGVKVTPIVYTCNNVIGGDFADKWHRVTIKAIKDITAGSHVPGFAIYIDGVDKNATDVGSTAAKWDNTFAYDLTEAADYLDKAGKLFPSMKQGGAENRDTLSCVAFDGTGYLNDLVVTDQLPDDFAKDHEANKATVVIGVKTNTFESIAEAIEKINDAENYGLTASLSLMKSMTLTEPIAFTGTGATTITLDFAGFVLTNNSEFAAITNSAASLTITNSVGKGGIYCTLIEDDETKGSACALYAEAGVVTINGGNFWGHLKNNGETIRINANAGAFLDDDVDLPEVANVPKGKNIVPIEGGLNEIVDKVYYWVTYDSDGGSVVANQQVESGLKATEPANPTKTGYTFAGWFAPEAESAYDFDTVVTGDITLTAHWTVNKYLVTFMNGEDTFATTNVEYNTVAVAPAPAPTKTGYTFNYWYTSDSAVAYDFDTPVTDVLTLNAKFTADTYTVTFYTNSVVYTTANYTYGDESSYSEPSDPSIDGYTFGGWYTDNNTFESAFTFDENVAGNTQVAYAKLTASGGSGIDPAAETPSTTVEAESAEAAEAAAKENMTVPSAAGDTPEAKEKYANLFTYTTVETSEGVYTVTLQDIKEEVKEAVAEDAVEIFSGESGKIAVPDGLYYRVSRYTAIGTPTETNPVTTGQATGDAGVTVSKPGTTQGFIKVEMATKPFN